MTISIDTASLFPFQGQTMDSARKLVRNVQGNTLTLMPEKTEEEERFANATLSIPKQLSPEEEKRVQFLKDTLAQILTLADGKPSDEQKAQIREIEQELEKITGVKMRSRISNASSKMLGEEEKEDETVRQLEGTAPEDAIHTRMPKPSGNPMCPALAAIQANALHTQLRTAFEGSESFQRLTLSD